MVGRTGAGKSSLLQARDVVFFFFLRGHFGVRGPGIIGATGFGIWGWGVGLRDSAWYRASVCRCRV